VFAGAFACEEEVLDDHCCGEERAEQDDDEDRSFVFVGDGHPGAVFFLALVDPAASDEASCQGQQRGEDDRSEPLEHLSPPGWGEPDPPAYGAVCQEGEAEGGCDDSEDAAGVSADPCAQVVARPVWPPGQDR
jgi:hypothetical protein